ncbi:MAG TPA: 2-C-methyl-D-erythritol 2,4-cyclodiphosphate synthase [Candidatus Coprenecus stercoripullorum]|nr:2-C-methyl-D-erythritol 2,4-cyclodiphosphate synthase [Candidatus Coprenecus stercoripullorum]
MTTVRIGNGYDVHRLEKGLRLVLCGVDIPHDRGCVAHSDGDVAIHALCDALLGAASLGDIGRHFPDTDGKYENIASGILLERVCGMLSENGYAVGNVDIVIVAQRPKVAPYIEDMRRNLSETMGIPVSSVSVKATTTERLGFTGREEGIAAYAVALIDNIR